MTAERPDVCPYGLYSGREAARLLGVDRHTLTRWKRGLKLVPATNDGRYMGKDIVRRWEGK
jgi:predicted site-specific integrase-resolvase